MMEKNADKVSLLIDGELDECDMACVMRAMKEDDTAGARWRNYHLIRDALQGNLPRHLPQDLAGRVALALEHEPIHLNPQHRHSSAPTPFRTSSRARATVSFALAASLSAIAVFGVGVMELNNGSPQQSTAMNMASIAPPLPERAVAVAAAPQPSAPTVQLAAAAPAKQQASVTVLAAAKPVEQAAPRRSSVAVHEVSPAATDLYDYLVNSHRYAPGAADTQAMLSYVQLVGYGPGR